ncbi:hypothetical protein AVEN_7023-1 [Araneus ventricosus]|uniref:von Hippel-Lindau disease tumour suppressor beta domain-containing protein n=1 Tax=Araneus ventricosus TaxID=182803 RepID=A0A4Y2JR53_ARAVE|nr:hypothetical protein AVEN_99973-1 [Araneus ventricosus]GBM91815.1 hypothetical protein AVEN_169972-1 [Araneus ventricosus]GBM92076.1 hypothetical protein AVEN_182303-1 [Araneus ventricosus]GBM92275.1 hypothetical protein AVEN_7023-1 [Araneus ventricosus]
MARVVTGFRSGPSRKACRLHITNRTARCINIIWLDYYGREINYGFVEPGTIKPIQSFEGHPWICRDSVTKRRLLLSNETYFVPTASALNGRRINNLPVVEVFVNIPMFSLLDLGADAVSKLVSSEEDVEALELPTTVKDLVALCYHNSQIVIPESSKI